MTYLLRGHEDAVQCAALLNDTRVCSGDALGEVVVWDLDSRRPIVTRHCHDSRGALSVTTCNDRLFSYGRDGVLVCVDPVRLQDKDLFSIRLGNTNFCNIAPIAGAVLAPCSEQNQLVVVDARTGKECARARIPDKEGMLMHIAARTSGGLEDAVYCATEAGSIVSMDLRRASAAGAGAGAGAAAGDGAPVVSSCKVLDDSCMCVDFDFTRGRGIAAGATDVVATFADEGGTLRRCSQQFRLRFRGCSTVRIRPDGKLAAVAEWGGRVRVLRWPKVGDLLASVRVHTDTVSEALFRQSDGALVLASRDTRLSLHTALYAAHYGGGKEL